VACCVTLQIKVKVNESNVPQFVEYLGYLGYLQCNLDVFYADEIISSICEF
jgi:hypothetical protein